MINEGLTFVYPNQLALPLNFALRACDYETRFAQCEPHLESSLCELAPYALRPALSQTYILDDLMPTKRKVFHR